MRFWIGLTVVTAVGCGARTPIEGSDTSGAESGAGTLDAGESDDANGTQADAADACPGLQPQLNPPLPCKP